MASFVKFQQFVEDLGLGVHNLDTGTIKIYLSNTAPNVATHAVKGDLAEIATGNGYSGPIDISATYTESGGTGTLAGSDQTITASGGTIATFRYIILYNDTPTSPADPLIGYYDHGGTVSLTVGRSYTVNFGASIFTVA